MRGGRLERGSSFTRLPQLRVVATAGLALREGGPWPVFAASGLPYLVEPRDGVRGAWIVRDWVRSAPDLEQNGRAWLAPSRARELLTALGGVEPARMAYAAATLVFYFARGYEYLSLDAGASMGTGLAAGADSLVERGGAGSLVLTLRLDDPSLPPDAAHHATAQEIARACQAAAAFTGLPIDDEGAKALRTNQVRMEDPVTGNGTLYFEMSRAMCHTLFGRDAYDRWWAEARSRRGPGTA